jgi:hypothetical protein
MPHTNTSHSQSIPLGRKPILTARWNINVFGEDVEKPAQLKVW